MTLSGDNPSGMFTPFYHFRNGINTGCTQQDTHSTLAYMRPFCWCCWCRRTVLVSFFHPRMGSLFYFPHLFFFCFSFSQTLSSRLPKCDLAFATISCQNERMLQEQQLLMTVCILIMVAIFAHCFKSFTASLTSASSNVTVET